MGFTVVCLLWSPGPIPGKSGQYLDFTKSGFPSFIFHQKFGKSNSLPARFLANPWIDLRKK